MNFVEIEREMMLERQREGIAKVKSKRKYRGRKPTVREKVDQIKALHAEGMSMGQIANRLGIGKGLFTVCLIHSPDTVMHDTFQYPSYHSVSNLDDRIAVQEILKNHVSQTFDRSYHQYSNQHFQQDEVCWCRSWFQVRGELFSLTLQRNSEGAALELLKLNLYRSSNRNMIRWGQA